ncbi:MAG: hypothetical protein DRJ67_06575 [Thermoprotei archaeon]|nr:MAG: hypothetical protein DRJ67_06575 [Thermoprotei archaeon]
MKRATSAIVAEDLVRVYKVSRGYFEPAPSFELWGGRFLYEVLMRNLRKQVIHALRGVSLTIGRGEFVVILGPNGSGKSTLLKILATIIPPTSGRAEVMGYDVVRERREAARQVSYIPSLLGTTAWAKPMLTVEQNLKVMCRLFGFPFDEVIRMAEELGLLDLMKRPFGSLSSGQQARVGLVIGLLKRSPVYLLDEPTMGLSPEASRLVREHLRELNKRYGITVVYVTHHPLECEGIADRVVILDRGRVVADASPDELVRKAGVEESVTIRVYNAYFDLRQVVNKYDVRYLHLKTLHPEVGEYELRVGMRSLDEALPRLLEEIISRGAKISRLDVRRATIEDAYLYYVGGGA